MARGPQLALEEAVDLQQRLLHQRGEAGGLAVPRGHDHGDGVVSDDVADAEAVGGDGPEAEALEARVAAVGGAQDVVLHCGPGAVLEERGQGQLVLVPPVPDAVERVEVAVLAEPAGALGGDLRVCGARGVQEVDLGLVRGVLVEQRLDELLGLQRHGADGLCAAVLEGLGHGGLVHGFEAAVEREVRDLEHLLDEGVWGAAEQGLDVRGTVVGEVEVDELVLRDQVRDAGLGEVQRRLEEVVGAPLELARDGDEVSGGGVGLRDRRRRRRRGVIAAEDVHDVLGDAAREAQNRVRVDVRGEPQHGVAVDARVLEVDAGLPVLGHDQLQLVVPAVEAGARLHVEGRAAQVVRVEVDMRRAAQHRACELVLLVCGKGHVVQADDEQRGVDQLDVAPVGAVRRVEQVVPDVGPHATRLRGEHAEGRGGGGSGGGGGGAATSASASAAVGLRVHDDGVQIPLELLGRRENGLVARVEHVEPVELRAVHHDHVVRGGVRLQVARGLAGARRDAAGAEQPRVLVHRQRRAAAHCVRT